jgi:signal transduction histidine kinase
VRSLHVQLFLWAVMPVTFVLIAFSFTGVYSHQQTMRDFVVERDMAIVQLLVQTVEDGLSHGVIGGDGDGLSEWLGLDAWDLPGTSMVIDGDGWTLVRSIPGQSRVDVRSVPGISEALRQREGFAIVQNGTGPLLVSFAPISGTEWLVVLQEPVQDLIGPLLRFPSLVPAIALGAGILSLLILLFGWWTIVRPLQQLARSAEQVSWGEYDALDAAALLRPTRGVQEVQDLRLALAEMLDRIRGYEAGVRDYLSAVTEGQEAERTRLARDLHDGPVQDLIALSQRAEMAQRLVQRGRLDGARGLLEELRRTGQQTLVELRRLIGALRPVYLEDLGFYPALEMLVRQASERTDAEIRLEQEQVLSRLDPEVELAAYRVAQEALNNAILHAEARHIAIRVAYEAQSLNLSVVDDGRGFVLPEKPDLLTKDGHYGLIGLQERATHLGGTLQVITAPGRGTRVVARLPAEPATR